MLEDYQVATQLVASGVVLSSIVVMLVYRRVYVYSLSLSRFIWLTNAM
jgi:hypothetical protein